MKNIIFSLILCIISTYSFAADFTTIRTAASIGDDAVASGSGTVTYVYVRNDSLGQRAREADREFLSRVDEKHIGIIQNNVEIEYRFIFSGTKMVSHESANTVSSSGESYKRNWKWVYDGELMGLLRMDPIGRNGLILPLGSVRYGNQIPLDINDPRYDALLIRGTPVGAFLDGNMADKTVTGIKAGATTEQIDGQVCEMIQGTSAAGEKITVWLAQNIMYRPKRIEIVSQQEKTIINNEFKNHGNGIWFPRKVTREVYALTESTKQEKLYSKETLTVHDDFKLNIEIPDDTFEISFPSGMIVYDFRTGNTFVAE